MQRSVAGARLGLGMQRRLARARLGRGMQDTAPPVCTVGAFGHRQRPPQIGSPARRRHLRRDPNKSHIREEVGRARGDG